MPDMIAMPRFEDGAIDMQELLRRLAEQVVNAVMDAEADQLYSVRPAAKGRSRDDMADYAHSRASAQQVARSYRRTDPLHPAHGHEYGNARLFGFHDLVRRADR